MFFDRYEIHIQAIVDFINGKCITFRSSSSQNIYIYIIKHEILYLKTKKKLKNKYKYHLLATGPLRSDAGVGIGMLRGISLLSAI